MDKIKILISVTFIKDIGGISTSIVNLLNEIHSMYDITLCVLSNYISPNVKIPKDIKILTGSNYLYDIVTPRSLLRHQNFFEKSYRNIRRVINRYILKDMGIEQAINRIRVDEPYDVAIAFSDFDYNRIKKKCYDYYFIDHCVNAKLKSVWIHNDPIKLNWSLETTKKQLKQFDYIVNVSYDCASKFNKLAPFLENKSRVVYNLYNLKNIIEQSFEYNPYENDSNEIIFVTVARVQEKQKRISRILMAVKRLNEEGYKGFSWYIVGEGGDMETYQAQIKLDATTDILKFVGLQSNPYPYVSNASAFVLCSEYDGFGMTIREAQILGIPTLITRFGAALEVVTDGLNGEICDNSSDGLYNMIKGILDDKSKLEQYREYLKKNPVTNDIGLTQFNSILCK